MKGLRREIFALGAVLHAPHDVRIDSLEIEFVEVGKAGRVPLRSFDQKPLIRFFLQSLHEFSAVLPYTYDNGAGGERLRCRQRSSKIGSQPQICAKIALPMKALRLLVFLSLPF